MFAILVMAIVTMSMTAQPRGHHPRHMADGPSKVYFTKEISPESLVKIFKALCRLYPNLDDKDRRGNSAILRHALRLKNVLKGEFTMIDFLSNWGFDTLSPADWMEEKNEERTFPSTAQRLLDCVIYELKQMPTPEMALKCVPILRAALAHDAQDARHQRLKELVYEIGK